MKLLISLVLVFGFQIAAHAQGAYPPGFNSAQWQKLVQTTIAKGDTLQGIADDLYKTLSHIVPNNTQVTHQAEYFVVRVATFNGVVTPVEVTEVSENWVLGTDGNWQIDQWDYEFYVEGQLGAVIHNRLVETPIGKVLSADQLNTPPVTDAGLLQQTAEKVTNWYGWEPGT